MNSDFRKKATLALGVIIFVVLADQITKFLVKTSMFIGQEYDVLGNWFKIYFIENEGMAFGLRLGGNFGKLLLSLFRIIAVILLGIYLWKLIRAKDSSLKITTLSLIFAGALGNIIDSSFYGLVFTESTFYQISVLSPGKGYAPFLHGRVVDMLYFPLIKTTLPDWLPIWGGQDFEFFRPVFNIADSAITIGVLILLIFNKKFFSSS